MSRLRAYTVCDQLHQSIFLHHNFCFSLLKHRVAIMLSVSVDVCWRLAMEAVRPLIFLFNLLLPIVPPFTDSLAIPYFLLFALHLSHEFPLFVPSIPAHCSLVSLARVSLQLNPSNRAWFCPPSPLDSIESPHRCQILQDPTAISNSNIEIETDHSSSASTPCPPRQPYQLAFLRPCLPAAMRCEITTPTKTHLDYSHTLHHPSHPTLASGLVCHKSGSTDGPFYSYLFLFAPSSRLRVSTAT